MRRAILSATTEVKVPAEAARDWFLSLEDHPERYQFATHQGFVFTQGAFGEPGSRFKTRETFLRFLRLDLQFEIAEVHATAFRFWLRRPPWLRIWGRFEIDSRDEERSTVTLQIGSETRLGQLLLRCYPIGSAVRGQIRDEVAHVKRSMEHVSGER